jgi:hypothetical protein
VPKGAGRRSSQKSARATTSGPARTGSCRARSAATARCGNTKKTSTWRRCACAARVGSKSAQLRRG